MTPNYDIRDKILIGVMLNFSYNNFDIITKTILEWGDKLIDKMQ